MHLEIARNATYVKLVGRGFAGGGGQRREIKGFSRQSRARLMEFFNQLDKDWRAHPLFVTLTYPGEYTTDWHKWKRDLDVFLKRVERLHKKCTCVWRLEFQKRGAPHFHILIFNIGFIKHSWIARAWYDVVGSGDERHLAAGTQIVRAKNDRHACSYVSKYVAKVDDEGDEQQTGRIWGVRGRRNIKRKIVKYAIDERMFYKIRRILRGWLERKLRRKLRHLRSSERGGVFFIPDTWVTKVMECVQDDIGELWNKLFFPLGWEKVTNGT